MELFTKEQRSQLVANRATGQEDENFDPFPVVKLFTPDAGATWLLTELDEVENIAFGLCDLGIGFPELGYVSIDELKTVRGHLRLPIERDLHFTADRSLSQYAKDALNAGRIVA